MDKVINQMVSFPWYIWMLVIGAFIFLIKDKKEWAYRVDLGELGCKSFGDVDISKYHRTKARIEVEIELDEKYRNMPVQILVNDSLVLTVPEEQNSGRDIDYTSDFQYQQPGPGDKLEVLVEGTVVLSGELKLS